MSNARASILAALGATRPVFGALRPGLAPVAMPADPEAVLRARIESAGGTLQIVGRRGWVDRVEWPVVLPAVGADPDAGPSIHSALPEIASQGLDRSASATSDFAQLDLCVLRGEFAVVENGAVWHVPRSPRERRAALLAEHLVVVIEGDALVASLHQAYERIDLAALSFGWLLCGPSKTADIEQALVLGAHGPRSQSVVWLRDAPGSGGDAPP